MTKPKSYYARLDAVQAPGDRWIGTSDVCRRYDISPSTLARWHSIATIGFPTPIQIVAGGVNLYSEQELDLFDARRAEQAPLERQRLSEQARERRRKVVERRKAGASALTAAPAGDDGAAAAAATDQHLPPQQVCSRS